MLELSHKKLKVWELGIDLIKQIYRLTKSFPKEELFGLTNQLRRASVSVLSNLSEGLSRNHRQEKKRYIEISRSSLVEIDTQLEISLTLGFCNNSALSKIDETINHLFASLTNLSKTIK